MSKKNNIDANSTVSTAVMQPLFVEKLVLNITAETANLANDTAAEKPVSKENNEPLPYTQEGNVYHLEDFFNSLRQKNMGESANGEHLY